MFADDAVLLFPDGKLELDLHLIGILMNEVVVPFGAGFTPQCPGHRIDNRGLAVAVIAANTHGMDAGKIERGDVFPVGHEIRIVSLTGIISAYFNTDEH